MGSHNSEKLCLVFGYLSWSGDLKSINPCWPLGFNPRRLADFKIWLRSFFSGFGFSDCACLGDGSDFGFFEFAISSVGKGFHQSHHSHSPGRRRQHDRRVPAVRADLLFPYPPPNGIDDSWENIQKPHENLNHQQSTIGINGITLATAFHTNIFPGKVDTSNLEWFLHFEYFLHGGH